MIRAHQPGSEPIDIPETIPNPVVVPKPTPTPTEPAPKEPVRIPEKVPASAYAASPPSPNTETPVLRYSCGMNGSQLATFAEEVSTAYDQETNRDGEPFGAMHPPSVLLAQKFSRQVFWHASAP